MTCMMPAVQLINSGAIGFSDRLLVIFWPRLGLKGQNIHDKDHNLQDQDLLVTDWTKVSDHSSTAKHHYYLTIFSCVVISEHFHYFCWCHTRVSTFACHRTVEQLHYGVN